MRTTNFLPISVSGCLAVQTLQAVQHYLASSVPEDLGLQVLAVFLPEPDGEGGAFVGLRRVWDGNELELEPVLVLPRDPGILDPVAKVLAGDVGYPKPPREACLLYVHRVVLVENT